MEKLKLLYVDDEEINLSNFRIAFQDNFQIITALSGAEALEIFHNTLEIAIIVADQKMPGISGIELLTTMYEVNSTPVRIILTAHCDVLDIIESVNKGKIYEYILKPWNEDELRSSLNKAADKFLLSRENARLVEELKQKNKKLRQANLQMREDMKKQRQMEKDLFAKQLELAHAGRLSSLGEMASGMAHEIHQPLTVIQLAAEGLLASPAVSSDLLLKDSVKDILAQVIRTEKVLKNVRSFSRSDLDNLQLLDPCRPLTNSLSFFREQLRVNGIELHEDISDELPQIKTDLHKFEQILVNFLSNARYAVNKQADRAETGYQQLIWVRLFQNSTKELVVEVEDNGIGMTPEVKERCLEPFYTTKEVNEGTGLGLSIAHGISRELGLTLEIDSEPGRGSVFRLLIPLGENL